MKVFVNKNLKCSVEIQFDSDSHAITPEMARELVTELEKALVQVEEVLPGFENEPKGIQDGLEEEIDRFEDWMETYNQADYPTSFTTRDIARHFAQWGAEHLKK